MRIIAIVNQKGGCGKTTTTVNLAGCLAADGAGVLVVDLDPQAHATLALGVDPEGVDRNLYDVLADEETTSQIGAVIVETAPGIALAPGGIVLSALEQKLAAERAEARTERLAAALAHLPRPYDYVLIDCPPNVGLLTFSALRAAQEVIVPLETSFFAIHGVQKLLDTIGLLTERIGRSLDVRILPTLYDGRTRYARETLADIRGLFGDLCFDAVIRSNVKLRECARRGVPAVRFAPSSNGALDYAALALEVRARAPERAQAAAPRAAAREEPAPATRQVVVRFRDEGARDVRIAGDFNGWVPDRGVRSHVEAEGEARVWTKVLELEPGTYQYRYVVDGSWREDPENPQVVPGPGGALNSLLVVR
ncbi:MAG TPA: AAA family ATPase [Myxococcota bacterium]|nr:AAA family ATPase [Myxococcota bacterium]